MTTAQETENGLKKNQTIKKSISKHNSWAVLLAPCCVVLGSPAWQPLSPTENSSSDQRQACKKHELYVSFRDLGWQVRAAHDRVPLQMVLQAAREIKLINGFFRIIIIIIYPWGKKVHVAFSMLKKCQVRYPNIWCETGQNSACWGPCEILRAMNFPLAALRAHPLAILSDLAKVSSFLSVVGGQPGGHCCTDIKTNPKL